MSVREETKNGESRWLAEVYIEGKRIRRYRRTEDEARRAEIRILDGLDRPERSRPRSKAKSAKPRSGHVPTLEQFAPRFLKLHAKVHNKRSEYDSKESKIRVHLVPEFGDVPLDEISEEALAEFVADKLDDELKPKTVNNILTTLNVMLKKAVAWGDLAAPPTMPWLDVEEAAFRFLDFAEARALTEAMTEPVWAEMITVALKTGLRHGELRALQATDVDLERGVLHVRKSAYKNEVGTPKTRASRREVPLCKSAAVALHARMVLGHGLVFCNDGGKLLTKEQCKWPLWRACDLAGLDRMGWHVLRHTFASHLAMKGRSLIEIRDLMGHTTIKMTQRYAHLSPDVKREAVAVLDE